MKRILLAFITTLFVLAVVGQDKDLAGPVISGAVSLKDYPVAGASVLLFSVKDSLLAKVTVTDSTGNYTFINIDPGHYFIKIQSIDCEDYKTGTFIISYYKQLVRPTIALRLVVKTMKAINVIARRPLIEKEIGKIVFNVENSILAIGNSAWDIVNKAPEVKTDAQGNVRLRSNKVAAVMINNKPVNVDGEDLVVLLRSISSENISKVEIITNPSAKYDAEGSGGIINILTKKNKEDGLNGLITTGYEQSSYAKYTAGLMLNYKHKNYWVSGNYGYKYGEYLTLEYLDQRFKNNYNTVFYNETLNRRRNQQTNNYKIDVEYNPDRKSTIGILVDGYFVNRINNDISHTPVSTIKGNTDSTFLSAICINGKNNYLSLSTSFRNDFDTLGRTLSINFDYLTYNTAIGSLNTNDFLNAHQSFIRPTSKFKSNTIQQISIYTSKLDYTHPIGEETTLQMGAKANITKTVNDYIFENQVSGVYIKDKNNSDQFIYREGIVSMYGDLTKTIGEYTLEAGLRGEYTNTSGNSLSLFQTIRRSYLKIFPTLYFQRKFSDKYQVELNYGRRIRRPSYADMNPFRYYSTPFSYAQGNPFLQPEFSNSLEMIHTFKDRYFVSVYYTSSRGEFIQIPEQQVADKTIAFNRTNLNSSRTYGVSLEIPFEFGNWWQSYNTVDLSHDRVSSPYLGSRFSYHKTMVNISSTQSFVLSETWSAELRANYRSPGISGLFHLGTYSELALGVKKKLLQNRAVLSLNFSDIFRGTILSARVNYLDQNSVARTDNDLRSIRINFSYRFGTTKASKQQQEKETGNREEQKRIGR